MIPKFRAWMPSLQWMCEVLAISWDDKYCDVRYLGDTERNTEMTVDFPEVSSLEEMEEGKEQLSTCFIVVGNIYENPELVEG